MLDNKIDKDVLLFIYKNVCIFNNLDWDDTDLDDEYLDGEQYKVLYIIEKLVQEIIIRTNREKFPTDLKYLVVDLANNAYSVVKNESNPDTNQNINSMSEAGRSVSFGATQTWQTKYQLLLDQQMKVNESLINKYKLLYKVVCPYAKN